jgi:hypothetical protein
MAEALGMMHAGGRGLLQGRWWTGGPKLVYNQIGAPVPEIMNTTTYINAVAVKSECQPDMDIDTYRLHYVILS